MTWADCTQNIDGATNIATLQCLPVVFGHAISGLLVLSGFVALVFIILSGIRMTLHGQDPKKIEEDKHSLLFAILGLIIALLAFFIVNTISGITGTKCILQFSLSPCTASSSTGSSISYRPLWI